MYLRVFVKKRLLCRLKQPPLKDNFSVNQLRAQARRYQYPIEQCEKLIFCSLIHFIEISFLKSAYRFMCVIHSFKQLQFCSVSTSSDVAMFRFVLRFKLRIDNKIFMFISVIVEIQLYEVVQSNTVELTINHTSI